MSSSELFEPQDKTLPSTLQMPDSDVSSTYTTRQNPPSEVMSNTVPSNIDRLGSTHNDELDTLYRPSTDGMIGDSGEGDHKPKYVVANSSSRLNGVTPPVNADVFLLHIGAQFDGIDTNGNAHDLILRGATVSSDSATTAPTSTSTAHSNKEVMMMLDEPWTHLRLESSHPAEDSFKAEEKIFEILKGGWNL